MKCECVAQAGEWTWMKGDSTFNSAGNFGTMGIPAATNEPPAVYAPFCWTDLQGKFWLLGGNNLNSFFTALWMYDPSANNWTWMKGLSSGDQAGVYGTLGVASASNFPGSRSGSNATWTDANGDLWLFGGLGYDASGNFGSLNDLWKYNIVTNEWTWEEGSNQGGVLPDYGTYQVASVTNTPGGRWETGSAWRDDAGNLWLFGGCSFNGYLDDVWKYDPGINEWTWMQGSVTVGLPAVYGTLGIPDAANTPGGRTSYCNWKDQSGNFWTFGGMANGYAEIYSDLWKFDPLSNEWTWMSGSNLNFATDNSGSLCESNAAFHPGARFENRSLWVDGNGNMWLYGGCTLAYTYNLYSDLWAYRIDSNDWTLVNGSTLPNQPGHYGVQGISSPSNQPGSKMGPATWIDSSGNLWMFGGFQDISALEYSNNLWKYVIDFSCPLQIVNLDSVNFEAQQVELCEKFCTSFSDASLNNPTAWQWLFPGGTPSSSTDQNPSSICYQIPGVFDVTLITTNANGTDTLTLHNYITVYPTPPFPTITQAGYTLTSSAAASYQWQFNSVDIPGATNQSYTILQTGYYTVVVGDSNGCKNSFTEYILISGINNSESDANISINPNPSSGTFMVEWLHGLTVGEVSINVMNTLGQKVFSSEESQYIGTTLFKKEIDLTLFANGVYYITLLSEDFSLKKKIVIAH